MSSLAYGEEADPSSKSMYLSMLTTSIFLFGYSSGSYHVNCLNISCTIGTNILGVVSGRDISL